jgi:hypothetical protein
MNYLRGIVCFFLGGLVLFSCSTPVEIAWKGDRDVVVRCILTEDSIQTVNVYFTASMQENTLIPVENASVFINGYDATHEERLAGVSAEGHKSGQGEWKVSITPVRDKEYTLEIYLPDGKKVSSTTRFPDINPAVPFGLYEPESWLFDEQKNWAVYEQEKYMLKHDLPAYCKSYSDNLFTSFLNSSGLTSFHHEMPGLIFRLDAGRYWYITAAIHRKDGQLIPIEYLATNNTCVDNSNATTLRYHFADYYEPSGNELRDRFDRETFPRYDGLTMHEGFLRIARTEEFDNGLRNVYRVSVDPLFATDDGTEFAPLEYANEYFTVVGSFASTVFDNTVGKEDEYPILYFSAVSEEYDRYLMYIHDQQLSGNMLANLYSNHQDMPDNIEGGYGIFGAVTTRVFPCHKQLIFGGPVAYGPPTF